MDNDLWISVGAALGVSIFGFGALYGIILWMRRRNRAVADTPELWRGREYACPGCGGEMEQGWVMLGKGAIFSSRARGRPGPFSHIGHALPNTISMHLKPASNMAWHCGSCRLLLLDHDKLVR
jgi:hypothetical protein